MTNNTRSKVILACGIVGGILAAITVVDMFDDPIKRIKLGWATATGTAMASLSYTAVVGGAVVGAGLAASAYASKDTYAYVKERKAYIRNLEDKAQCA